MHALRPHPGQALHPQEPGHPRPGPRGLHRPARSRQAAIRGRGANIFTQWVGDPDALGSALMLKAILKKLGAKEVRILTGGLGHPQNRNLVQRCGIELHDPNEERLPRGPALHGRHLAAARHGEHRPRRAGEATTSSWPTTTPTPRTWRRTARAQGVRRVKLAFVGLPVGSTSAFMAAIGLAFDVLDDSAPPAARRWPSASTPTPARCCTARPPLDFRMFEKLTRDEETHDIARRAARLPRAARVVHLPRAPPSSNHGDARARCASRRSATCARTTAT